MVIVKSPKSTVKKVPILVSCPHVGTDLPDLMFSTLVPELASRLQDGDWFVDQLYDGLVESIGATVMTPKYHRYVIDLNRSRDDQTLYNDGRLTTGLFPMTTFDGAPIYKEGYYLTDQEKQTRLLHIYDSYHNKLQSTIELLRAEFGKVILVEGHSIERYVPAIFPQSLPDVIISNNDNTSCPAHWLEESQRLFQKAGFSVNCNHPFKGGFITRRYADPKRSIFTLQFEMSQDIYMDLEERKWQPVKAAKVIAAIQFSMEKILAEF